MPSTMKIRVLEARDLPVMDRTSNLTDAFVEIRFANHVHQTSIVRKTLNPVWKEDTRFNVADDSDLQNEPLVFRVMDHDVYSADDLIGTVYIGLGPLVQSAAESAEGAHGKVGTMPQRAVSQPLGDTAVRRFDEDQLDGWFPIYDTLNGIRGELHVVVKISLYGNENPFKDSSAGVRFFETSFLDPSALSIGCVFGFVEELVVETDPEYEWSDNFRTARKSNESRQGLLYKLSNQVRRQIGKKVLELGGNAVIGYRQTFDVEGDSGLVARGAGTACILSQAPAPGAPHPPTATFLASSGAMPHAHGSIPTRVLRSSWPAPHTLLSLPHPPNSYLHKGTVTVRAREETSEEPVGTPPADLTSAAAALDEPDASAERLVSNFVRKMPGLEKEVVLLTINVLPVNARLRLGGVVAARSVKYLGRLAAKIADQETRDQWWAELREEIRSHARSLHCQHVLGYREDCVIYEDVCVLQATGTAAVVLSDRPVWGVVPETREPAVPGLGPAVALAPPSQLKPSVGPAGERMVTIARRDKAPTASFDAASEDGAPAESAVIGVLQASKEANGATRESPLRLDDLPSSNFDDATDGASRSSGNAPSFLVMEMPTPSSDALLSRGLEDGHAFTFDGTPRRRSSERRVRGQRAYQRSPRKGGRPLVDANALLRRTASARPIQASSPPSAASAPSPAALSQDNSHGALTGDGLHAHHQEPPLAPQQHQQHQQHQQAPYGPGMWRPKPTLPCAIVHVPYRHDAAPFANMRLVPCGLCRKKWVPEVLLSTIEAPPLLPITGQGVMVEARVCRTRPKVNSKAEGREADASMVSESLVFLEIELHKQLMLKLKVLGMNAAFGLRSQVHIGASLMVGVTTATAVHSPALPPPAVLRVHRSIAVEDQEDRELISIQRRIEETALQNRERILALATADAEAYREAIAEAKQLERQRRYDEQERLRKATLRRARRRKKRRKARARRHAKGKKGYRKGGASGARTRRARSAADPPSAEGRRTGSPPPPGPEPGGDHREQQSAEDTSRARKHGISVLARLTRRRPHRDDTAGSQSDHSVPVPSPGQDSDGPTLLSHLQPLRPATSHGRGSGGLPRVSQPSGEHDSDTNSAPPERADSERLNVSRIAPVTHELSVWQRLRGKGRDSSRPVGRTSPSRTPVDGDMASSHGGGSELSQDEASRVIASEPRARHNSDSNLPRVVPAAKLAKSIRASFASAHRGDWSPGADKGALRDKRAKDKKRKGRRSQRAPRKGSASSSGTESQGHKGVFAPFYKSRSMRKKGETSGQSRDASPAPARQAKDLISPDGDKDKRGNGTGGRNFMQKLRLQSLAPTPAPAPAPARQAASRERTSAAVNDEASDTQRPAQAPKASGLASLVVPEMLEYAGDDEAEDVNPSSATGLLPTAQGTLTASQQAAQNARPDALWSADNVASGGKKQKKRKKRKKPKKKHQGSHRRRGRSRHGSGGRSGRANSKESLASHGRTSPASSSSWSSTSSEESNDSWSHDSSGRSRSPRRVLSTSESSSPSSGSSYTSGSGGSWSGSSASESAGSRRSGRRHSNGNAPGSLSPPVSPYQSPLSARARHGASPASDQDGMRHEPEYASSSMSSSDEELNVDEGSAEEILQQMRSDKRTFVIEVDDETDEDVMAVVLDKQLPPGVVLCNTEVLPHSGALALQEAHKEGMITLMMRKRMDEARPTRLNTEFAELFHELYGMLAIKLVPFVPCSVSGLHVDLTIPSDFVVEVLLTAVVHRTKRPHPFSGPPHSLEPRGALSRGVPGSMLHRSVRRLGLAETMVPISIERNILDTMEQRLRSAGSEIESPPHRPGDFFDSMGPNGPVSLLPPPASLADHPGQVEEAAAPMGGTDVMQGPHISADRAFSDMDFALPQHASGPDTGGSSRRLLSTRDDSSRISARGPDLGVGRGPRTKGSPILSRLNPAKIARHLHVPIPSLRGLPFRRSASGQDSRPVISAEAPAVSAPIGEDLEESLVQGIMPDPEAAASRLELSRLALPTLELNWRPQVVVTPLAFVPDHRIVRYLGRINLHFIRESWAVREGGGLGRFFHLFLNEAQSIARAHVLALRGNVMLSFKLTPRESTGKALKSVYNVISISGDVAIMEHDTFASQRSAPPVT